MHGKIIAISALALMAAGLGCAPPTAAVPQVSIYHPRFQYAVPKAEVPGSAMAAISIVNFNGNSDLPLTTFQARFLTDLQNVLVARGFNVKGPFATRDEMTYSDKKSSDFILLYSLSAQNQFQEASVSGKGNISDMPKGEEGRIWNGTYSTIPLIPIPIKNYNGNAVFFHGTLGVSAKINLTLVESMTGEKLWTKTLDISAPAEAFDTSSPHALANGEAPVAALRHDVMDLATANAINKSLDGIYTNALDTVWKHLDPQELHGIKTQADEIKAKKVF